MLALATLVHILVVESEWRVLQIVNSLLVEISNTEIPILTI